MITVLNRRRIMTDTNSGVLVQARDRLKAAGVESEMRTVRSQSARDLRGSAMAQARFNLPAGTGAPVPQFVYYLYVRRRDFARVKELLKI